MSNENLKQKMFGKYVKDYVLPLIGHTSDECKTFNFTWQVDNNNDDYVYFFLGTVKLENVNPTLKAIKSIILMTNPCLKI